MKFRQDCLILLTVFALSGCTVNPVTGEHELSLLPASQALSMGAQQYQPTIQAQGGKYYVDPELSLYVSEVGQKLASVSDRPDLPYEFVVLNSGVPNAWALPGGKVAVNRGLLTAFDNEGQLAAVLGHEITHAAANHSAQQMQRGMLINLGVAGLGLAVSDSDYSNLILGGAAVGSQLTMARYSRGDESEADHYGIEYMVEAGYDPQAAVALQKVFVKLSEGNNSSWINGLFASHPPSEERVEANQAYVDKLDAKGGRLGKDTYDKKMAYLRSKQPAYDAETEARKLAKEDNLDEALAKINKSIEIEPDEAAFYNLRGKILETKGKSDQALKNYNKASSLYPEMFSYRINRGSERLDHNDFAAAKADFEAANETVPTSIAHLRLGDIAAHNGQTDEAAKHYKVAAQAKGEIAQEAQRKLARLTQ